MITSSKQTKIIIWVSAFVILLLCLLLVFIFAFQYSKRVDCSVFQVNLDQYLQVNSADVANRLKQLHSVMIYFHGIEYDTKIAFYSSYNNVYYFQTNLALDLSKTNTVQVQLNHLTLWEILH